MSNGNLESRGGGAKSGENTYPPAYYSTETMWTSWLVPMIVVANVGMFIAVMYVNDCPKYNLRFEGACVAKFLGRLSFEPLRENPLFGPSSSTLLKRAQTYQEYMKGIQIPTVRGSVIPFNTWQELGKSLKQLYKQPLHYLTNVQLKQWDKARLNTNEEDMPMDNIVHPAKAEATIWIIEEIHRYNTSHHFLAKLWLNDPMYHAFFDPLS